MDRLLKHSESKRYVSPQTEMVSLGLFTAMADGWGVGIDGSYETEESAKKHDFDADEFDFEENGGVGEWSSDWSSEWKTDEE